MNTDLNLAGIIESARSVADKAALSAPDPNADLREAAEQFEAIFLNEFIKMVSPKYYSDTKPEVR